MTTTTMIVTSTSTIIALTLITVPVTATADITTTTETTLPLTAVQAREVLQISLGGLEVRHAVTDKYTDSSVTVESFQVRHTRDLCGLVTLLTPQTL